LKNKRTYDMKTKTLLVGLGICLLAACSGSKGELNVDKALDYCDAQVHRTLTELKVGNGSIDYTLMPRNIMDSLTTWHCRKATKDEWCSGFWPGILWYDYEATGDEQIKAEAEKFTSSLKFLSETPAFDHDLGVSCLLQLRQRLSADSESRIQTGNFEYGRYVGYSVQFTCRYHSFLASQCRDVWRTQYDYG